MTAKRLITPSYILVLVSLALTIACFIVYMCAGPTQYDPDYSAYVIMGFVIAIALGIFSAVKPMKYVLYAQYVFALFGTFSFFGANANLYGNIFMALDGGTLPIAFFAIAVLALAATFTALAAAILTKRKGETAKEVA